MSKEKPEAQMVREVTEALTGEVTPVNIKTVTHDGVEQEHKLEGKRLMLLVHQGGLEVHATDEDIFTITAEDTVKAAAIIPAAEWAQVRVMPKFVEYFKMVFEFDPPVNLAASTIDVRHVVGMMLLLGKALAEGKRPFIKLPETYLHPKQQSNIASFLVKLSGGE